MPRRIDIDDEVFQRVADQCPKYLSPTGFINLILDKGVDKGVTLGKPSPERAEGRERGEGFTSSSNTLTITNTSKEVSKCAKQVPTTLDDHADLILAFWKVKKGSKGDIAWNRLIGQLERLQAAYGASVLSDQLELAINGKWAGIEVSRYESFLKPSQIKQPPKSKLTAEQEEAKREAEHQQRLKEWGLI